MVTISGTRLCIQKLQKHVVAQSASERGCAQACRRHSVVGAIERTAPRRHCRPARNKKLGQLLCARFCIQEFQIHEVTESAHAHTRLLTHCICALGASARAKCNVGMHPTSEAPRSAREFQIHAPTQSGGRVIARTHGTTQRHPPARKAIFILMSRARFPVQGFQVTAVAESGARMPGRIYAPTQFAIRGVAQTNATRLARKAALAQLPSARSCARRRPRHALTESGGRALERIRIPTPLPTYKPAPTKTAARAHIATMMRRYVYPR